MRGLSLFAAWRREPSRCAGRRKVSPFCPRVEVLEDRTVLSPTAFTGADSANPQAWNDALNWTAGIPTDTSDVMIGAGFTVNLSSNSSINTLSISGAFNLSGANLVLNSTASINSTGGLALTNGASIDVPAGVTNAGSVSIASGCNLIAGTYAQTSGSTLEGGRITTSSGVNVEGGSLSGRGTISGSLFNSGQLYGTGSPGALSVTGDFTQLSSGILDEEIGGTAAGTGYDQLNVSGTANLAGTLNISLINGFEPPSSVELYQILTFGSRNGDFTSKNGLMPNFAASYDSNSLTLQSPAVPITTATLPNWVLNQPGYNQTIMASGGSGAFTFAKTAGTLPPGLNLGSSGVLSGTPFAAGSYNFTVTVTDSGGATGSQSYTVVILVNSTFSVETFASNGLWRHNDSSGWQQLTLADASNIAVDDHGNVAAVFFNGLWRYEDAGGWQNLTPALPSQIDIAGNGIVVAEFPGSGLWRYGDPAFAGGGWQQLMANDARGIAVDDRGDTVAAFPGSGTLLYQDSSGWQQLSPAAATQVSIAASGISVAAVFQGDGVWRYNFQGTAIVTAGWQQLTPANAQQLAIGPTGGVVCAFNNGVWLYQDSGGWVYLTPALASQLSITNTADVVAEFSGSGVWKYSTGWQQLTPADAKLVRGAGA